MCAATPCLYSPGAMILMPRTVAMLLLVATVFFGQGGTVKIVCAALQGRNTVSEQVIALRGVWVENEEWAAVSAHDCDLTLSAGGVDWPLSIELVNPRRGTASAAFTVSFQQAVSTIRAQREAGRKGNVLATFSGRLETKPLRAIALRDGKVVHFGFGHGGVFPARLILGSVRDVVVLK